MDEDGQGRRSSHLIVRRWITFLIVLALFFYLSIHILVTYISSLFHPSFLATVLLLFVLYRVPFAYIHVRYSFPFLASFSNLYFIVVADLIVVVFIVIVLVTFLLFFLLLLLLFLLPVFLFLIMTHSQLYTILVPNFLFYLYSAS